MFTLNHSYNGWYQWRILSDFSNCSEYTNRVKTFDVIIKLISLLQFGYKYFNRYKSKIQITVWTLFFFFKSRCVYRHGGNLPPQKYATDRYDIT